MQPAGGRAGGEETGCSNVFGGFKPDPEGGLLGIQWFDRKSEFAKDCCIQDHPCQCADATLHHSVKHGCTFGGGRRRNYAQEVANLADPEAIPEELERNFCIIKVDNGVERLFKGLNVGRELLRGEVL